MKGRDDLLKYYWEFDVVAYWERGWRAEPMEGDRGGRISINESDH